MKKSLRKQNNLNRFESVKRFLLENADAIEKEATRQHIVYLGEDKLRGAFLQKYKDDHIRIVQEIAKQLDNKDRGIRMFHKLSEKMAGKSVHDRLHIEEAVNGSIFLKEAIWKKIEEAGLLNTLTAKDVYLLGQRIGIYVDIFSSKVALAYHEYFKQQELAGEKRYRSLIEKSTDVVSLSDTKGNYSYVTPSIKKALGYSPREFTKMNGFSIMHPDEVPFITHEFTKLLANPGSSETIEIRARHKNGSWRWLEATATNLLHNPDVRAIVSNFRDITERKEAEEKAAHFAQIVEASDDAIISRKLTGEVISWNKGAEKVYGYTADEMQHRLINRLIPKDRIKELAFISKKLAKGQHIEHFETVRIRKDGEHIDVSISLAPVKDEKGKVVAISTIARDISERKKQERQKDDFMAIVSHELKTPVTSVKAFTQILQMRFTQLGDEKSSTLLSKMDTQINKLSGLINDILDTTRMESGKLKFNEEYFYFDELVDEVVEEMQRTAKKHTIEKNGRTHITLFGDRDRIGQVIVNFLSNALKYSPSSDKIIVESTSDKKSVTLCVRDFGVGIPKTKQAHVFDRFYRVSGDKQETVPGIGLGLYICREIIKREGGKIWVESQKNQGSTFCFTLPIKKNRSAKKSIIHRTSSASSRL